MARVRLLVSRVVRTGNERIFQAAGDVVRTTADEARRMIEAGQAESVHSRSKKRGNNGD